MIFQTKMLVDELLRNPSVSRFEANGVTYGLRVLRRGESLFFQEQDRGLICVFDAVNSVLYTGSIKSWGGSKKMSPKERGRAIDLICAAYRKIFNRDITLINSNS